MNDEIKELLGQIEMYISTTNFEGMPEDEMSFEEIFFNKFVELIVKECLMKVREEIDTDYNWGLAGGILAERVLNNFGVK